jgi:maltooligosyltrehalose trehalohydrolase
VHLVLENHANQAERLARDEGGRVTASTAQWNDDVHHALHVLATGERDGYYVDYADTPLARLGRGLAEGFVYQGEASRYAAGEPRGTPCTHLPPPAFVNSLQTHDQVGNRAFGERIAALVADAGREDALRALLACFLLSPPVPMLFMGEEFAASAPFLYFCDFQGDLARAVTEGRRREFARFARFADPAARERIPDPNAEATFRASKIDWTERQHEPHSAWLALYQALLARRREALVPWLPGSRCGTWHEPERGTLAVQWPLAGGRRWHLLAQLSDAVGPARLARTLPGREVWRSAHAGDRLSPWSVHVRLEEPPEAGADRRGARAQPS